MEKEMMHELVVGKFVNTAPGICFNKRCPREAKVNPERAHRRYEGVDGKKHGTCSSPCTEAVDTAIHRMECTPPSERPSRQLSQKVA